MGEDTSRTSQALQRKRDRGTVTRVHLKGETFSLHTKTVERYLYTYRLLAGESKAGGALIVHQRPTISRIQRKPGIS